MTVEAPIAWEVTDDVDVFSDMLRRCYLPFAMTGEDAELGIFSATVQERPLGPLRLVDGITSPHGGIRRARQVSTTPATWLGCSTSWPAASSFVSVTKCWRSGRAI